MMSLQDVHQSVTDLHGLLQKEIEIRHEATGTIDA